MGKLKAGVTGRETVTACYALVGLLCLLREGARGARGLPKLPGDLSWDVDFKGCKEATRLAWHDPKKAGRICQVYVLDMSDLAGHASVPQCDLANFVTDLHQSLILPNPVRLGYAIPPRDKPEQEMMYPWGVGPHSLAQSSGPWYFYQALQNSSYITGDINAADAVFVYDYCYMIWGLAEEHGRYHWFLRQNGFEPNREVIHYVLQLYHAVSTLPRYWKDRGQTFVFWQPHTSMFGDAGLWGASQVPKYTQHYACNVFQNALFLVPSVYLRWRCSRYHPERTLVVPQASMEVLKGGDEEEEDPLSPPERDIFIMFKASCQQPKAFFSQGKKFRSELVKALLEEKAPDMHVQCSVGEIGSPDYNELSHQELMALLFRSVFCPVLPGDDQNSQHLTERYIAGCIPVFIGPPYHTMPFEKEVNYAESALFFNISDPSPWLGDLDMEWRYPKVPQVGDLSLISMDPFQRDAESPRWWMPMGIAPDDLVTLHTLADVVAYLRAVPKKHIAKMQAAVALDRPKFIYRWEVDGRSAANRVVLDNICHFVGKYCDVKSSSRRASRRRSRLLHDK